MRLVERNRDLLLTVADIIDADPARYDQSVWLDNADNFADDAGTVDVDHPSIHACETRACIAGHALLAATPLYVVDSIVRDMVDDAVSRYRRYYGDDATDRPARVAIDMAGVLERLTTTYYRRGIAGSAADLLGLTDGEAGRLFDGEWRPLRDLDVPAALRALADGADVADVTHIDDDMSDDEPDDDDTSYRCDCPICR